MINRETLKQIAHRASFLLKKAFAKLKELWKLPYAKTYILLSVVLTFFLITVMFPYDVLLRQQIRRIEPALGQGVFVGDIDFNVFRDSHIDELSVVFHNRSEASLKNLSFNFSYNPFTLFMNKTLKGRFSVQNFTYESGETSVTAVAKCLLDFRYNPSSGMPENGEIRASLNNVSIKGINIKGFNMAPVRFTLIDSVAVFQRDEIRVSKISFTGIDLTGEIRGSIKPSRVPGNSLLNLVIEIDTGSKLLEDYKVILGFLPKPSGNKITVPVAGTLSNPKIQLPSGQNTGE